MKKKPEVSIILTCFNEGWLMEETLKKIKKVMDDTKFSYEIIFVDDGSVDDSVEKIKRLIKKYSGDSLRLLINQKNQGRGFSVAQGIKAARGEIVGFIDPDLEIPACYVPDFIREVQKGNEVVISKRQYQGQLRKLPRNFASHLYSFLVKVYLRVPLEDTEAGLKFFKRKSILPILNQVQDKRWFWDTELVARSYFNGLKISKIPTLVLKRKDKKTTVHLLRDTFIYLKNLYYFGKLLKEEKGHEGD